MESNKYSKFTSTDFSKDDYFLHWRFIGDKDSCFFWEQYIRENQEQWAEIEKAIQIISSVQFVNQGITEDEKKAGVLRLEQRLKETDYNHKVRKIIASGISVAAIFLLFFFTGWFFHPVAEIKVEKENVSQPTVLPATTIQEKQAIVQKKKEKEILLISGKNKWGLDNNAEISIDRQGSVLVCNETGEKRIISPTGQTGKENIDPAKLELNKLIVPAGKHFFLSLSDGSKVWINAGTTLEFPTTFAKEKREITVDGEIYIEVAQDKTCPFFVITDEVKIEVLGTKFNVSSYKTDKQKSIVLVEGSIQATTSSGASQKLRPNHLLGIVDNNITIQEVDVFNHISWKDGLLCFENETLENILTRLSRYYDIHIDYSNEIADLRYSGKLVLEADIQKVLNHISIISPPLCYKPSKKGIKVDFSTE